MEELNALDVEGLLRGKIMANKWPERKERNKGFPRTDIIQDDIDDAYENSWNQCREAFMAVINSPQCPCAICKEEG